MGDLRVEPLAYVVFPSAYDEMGNSDRDYWCLTVADGNRWGWYITRGRGMTSSGIAMNRKGELIFESRGSGRNKPRRWPLEKALEIAKANVDNVRINGSTAAEAALRWPVKPEEATDA